MGSDKDVMELFAERDIRQTFRTSDGWKITPVTGSNSHGLYFRISRNQWVGEEVAYIAVSMDPAPLEDVINVLDALPDGRESRTKKYLLTPRATRTSEVPPHIRVLLMTAFAFSDGKLVWLTKKKYAMRFVAPEQITAA